MVVNKIGSRSKKIAADAQHELRILLNAHPKMVQVVAREVNTKKTNDDHYFIVRAYLKFSLMLNLRCLNSN